MNIFLAILPRYTGSLILILEFKVDKEGADTNMAKANKERSVSVPWAFHVRKRKSEKWAVFEFF